MKNKKIPTACKLTVVRQLCNYIPNHLVPKLARETGVDEQARTYDEWSHIVTLCYAQVTPDILTCCQQDRFNFPSILLGISEF